MLSHKSLTILFSALFLFLCWGSPRFPVRIRCQKILQKVHLPCTKLLYADLLGTCCNILEKSIATLCLSFPIGCMGIKTHNYLCKPACVGVTYILLKSGGVRTSQGVSVVVGAHLATWPVDTSPNLAATNTQMICPDLLEDINTQDFPFVAIMRIGQQPH